MALKDLLELSERKDYGLMRLFNVAFLTPHFLLR